MIDLSIITVTYCSEEHVEALIRSVAQGCKRYTFEHLIIDNASSDKTVERARNAGVVCLVNEANLGFAAANLIGYKQAKGRHLLFLNPDMVVEAGGIDAFIEWFDKRPEVGIAGCRLLDGNGNVNWEALPRRFPCWVDQFTLLLKLHKVFPRLLDSYFYKDRDFTNEQAVDTVRGSFMLMRRTFIEALGWPFDPRFYIWFEDVDICREARRLGFRVVYNPIASCRDAVGQSFRKRNRKWRFRQYAKSLNCYFSKWEPFYTRWWIPLLYMPLAYMIGSRWIEKVRGLCKR